MEVVCVGIILILLYVLNEKTNALQETQDELTNLKREISNINYHRQRIMSEADSYHVRKIAETDKMCAEKLNELTRKQDFVEKFVKAKISAFPEVATVIADLETAVDKMKARQLETKTRPAPVAAEEVRAIRKEKRELIKRIKALEWEMTYIRRLLPWIDEIEDSLMEPINASEYYNPAYNASGASGYDIDNAGYWLTQQEYRSLSTTKKNQLALDRYNKRQKSNMEIGRDYERYIGYLFEQEGFRVEYIGIKDGMNDLGRDLICTKGNSTYVVQCKCWSNKRGTVIREKHINQIYGTTFKYYLEQRNKHRAKFFSFGHSENLFAHEIVPMFVSTVPLSDTALEFVKELGIKFKQMTLERYPVIKCNINSRGEKIYHLPFDQMYDKTDVSKTGEFYAMTVAEAEKAGFRRAKRWTGN